VTPVRDLDWHGCFNVRDLGGLNTTDGHTIRRGALVRADDLSRLTARGWSALLAHGVRTVVDLRNADALTDLRPRPPELSTVRVALGDVADTEFWELCRANDLDGTPLYYRPFLDRKPERCAAAVAAVARAGPGGGVIHCGAGRDRTDAASARARHGRSRGDRRRLRAEQPPAARVFWAARGEDDQKPVIDEILRRKNTSARALLLDLLASLDVDAYLRSGGLGDDGAAAGRARLLGRELDPAAAR